VSGVNSSLAGERSNTWQRETLTDGFWGLNKGLEEKGIELGLSATQIYQQNAKGGVSTQRRAGRFSGSYDLEMFADLDRFARIKGGRVYMLAEGKWSKSQGINDPSVGSFFNVNGDALPRRAIDVTELWYEQALASGALRLRVGKMDLTAGFEHHNCPVSFDCSNYANDENTQFLNGGLVNNPAIPFPDYGLGIAAHFSPQDSWYISAAVADAQADLRETGFRTTFHGQDYFFYILEAGITPELDSATGPLLGAYRLGIWYDPQAKQDLSSGKTRRDDTGFYITCDQVLYRENGHDSQGLGIFGRYGWADSKVNELTDFWSAGLQYQGLFPQRDDDVLGLGFAHGTFSDEAGFTEDYESAFELYYSAQLAPWLILGPDIQYVVNPGGNKTVDDALVVGVRLQIVF
jgi:porin